VSFDDNADRKGDFELWNCLSEGQSELESVAIWTSAAGTFIFHPHIDALTWSGGVVSTRAPPELVACAPGQQWDTQQQLCALCPSNWFSPGGVGPEATCAPCEAGRVSNASAGETECTSCPPGTARSFGGALCEPCPKGQFASGAGQSACALCEVGSFAPTTGSPVCEECGEGMTSKELFTTMVALEVKNETEFVILQGATDQTQCGCSRGSRNITNGECTLCTEGMICSKGMGIVTIEEGFYAEAPAGDELSIFHCYGDWRRCTGGVAGETCAPGRVGIACAECEAGSRAGDDGVCVRCDDHDSWPVVVVIVVAPLVMALAYHFLDRQRRATQSHAVLLCGCALGQLMTMTQQLGVVGTLSLDWEEPIKSILDLLGLLTFNIEVMRFSCLSSADPVQRFSVKLYIIFITAAVMMCIHSLFVILRHERQWRARMHVLISAVGTVFMVFNIAVTSTVLQPFQCQHHPNAKWTVRAYPSILCWESRDHTQMLILGTIAFLLIPVLYIIVCMVVVKKMPAKVRAGDTEFLLAFSFLFIRFHANRHFYVLVHILRSFFVAVVLVIPDVLAQLFVLDVILLLGQNATLYWWPWRVASANWLDAGFGGGALLFSCVIPVFLSAEDRNPASTAWLGAGLISFLIALAPVAVMYGIHRRFCRHRKQFQYFICHHKNGAGAYTRLLKMYLVESPLVAGGVFLDSDNLDNLDNLFNYVAHDTDCLLVMCTSEIFSRPWCVGEMCIARLKKVALQVILFPACELPHAGHIERPSDHIDGKDVLTEAGLTNEVIAETYDWIWHQHVIEIPQQVNNAVLQMLVDKITSLPRHRHKKAPESEEAEKHLIEYPTMAASTGTGGDSERNVSMYDRSNMEAAATAHILKKFLLQFMSDKPEGIPEPFEEGHCNNPKVAVVICTPGMFEKRSVVAQILAEYGRSSPSLLPLICSHNFVIPPKDNMGKLVEAGFNPADAQAVQLFTAALFKEIAITFVAQHQAEAHLELSARDIMKRLDKKLKHDSADQIIGRRGSDLSISAAASATSIKSDLSRSEADLMKSVQTADIIKSGPLRAGSEIPRVSRQSMPPPAPEIAEDEGKVSRI